MQLSFDRESVSSPKELCKAGIFNETIVKNIPLTNLKDLYSLSLCGKVIRLTNPSTTSAMTFAYIVRSDPLYKPILQSLSKNVTQLCRKQVSKGYLDESGESKKSVGLIVALVPSVSPEGVTECEICGFALMALRSATKVSGLQDMHNERVGEIQIVCALENKVEKDGVVFSWGLGIILQYFALKTFYECYDCTKAIAYAASPFLVHYYMKLGWTFGFWDRYSADNIASKSKEWKDYELALSTERSAKREQYISSVTNRLYTNVKYDLLADTELLIAAIKDDVLQSPDEDDLAEKLAGKIVQKKEQLFLMTYIIDPKRELKELARQSFKIFQAFIDAGDEESQTEKISQVLST